MALINKTFYTKRVILAFLITLLSNGLVGQTDSSLFFLKYDNGFSLMELNVFNNQAKPVSPNALSSDVLFNSNSTIDRKNNILYFNTSSHLLGVNLINGAIQYRFNQNNTNFLVYSCTDSSLYGMTKSSNAKYFFTKVNPLTGTQTILSKNPITDNVAANGLATINPFKREYYFQDFNGLKVIDMDNGNLISQSNTSEYIAMMRFNPKDHKIYGLVNDKTANALYLGTVNPTNGTVSRVSSTPLLTNTNTNMQVGSALSSLSDIDIENQYFYFQSVVTDLSKAGKPDINIEQVDIASGQIVKSLYQGEIVNFMALRNNCMKEHTHNTGNHTALIIYPVPSNDVINVELREVPLNSKFIIYNSLGYAIVKLKAQQKMKVDIGSFKSGVYSVSVVTTDGKISIRKNILIE